MSIIKKEIKKGILSLLPRKKKVNQAIKDIENLIRDPGFSS
ncbi:conserved hypothetical protein (plasmid) [Borreliella garinii Far04]|nr:conserved hypothetical protein [Borreliella garinii Far04]